MVETALTQQLIAHADTAALLGSNPIKFYPGIAPQNTAYPFVVFRVVSNVPSNTKDAVSTLDKYRVQISVFSDDVADISPITNHIKTVFDGQTWTVSGYTVQRCDFAGEEDLTERGDSHEIIYHKALDFRIFYKR